MFRDLRADEIEVRVQSCKQNGCVLLLYKDARCDMNILDETVTPLGWKREHLRDNKNCIVSLWDDKKNQWVSKEDTGTESNTEQQKGLASDSFKRACFNWGIGRELYTAPFTWVNLNKDEVNSYQGKFRLNFNVKFHVSEIVVENKHITKLVIKDQNENVRFNMGKKVDIPNSKPKSYDDKSTEIRELLRSGNIPPEDLKIIKNDLNNKKIIPNDQYLNKLLAMYGSNK